MSQAQPLSDSNKQQSQDNDTMNNNPDNQANGVQEYINPELFNDDEEESNLIEKLALKIKPYYSPNCLPTSKYLQKSILPLIYEALNQVDKMRPKEPVEFFAAYLLDKNKKEL